MGGSEEGKGRKREGGRIEGKEGRGMEGSQGGREG